MLEFDSVELFDDFFTGTSCHVLLRDHVIHYRLPVNPVSSTQTVDQSGSSNCCTAVGTMAE